MSLKRTVLGLAAIYLACTSALWAGDGVWTTTYPFGGVIPAGGLALDPSEPARIYAAPNWRGLYRSEDAAASWQDLTADEMNSSFRSFMQFLTTDATGSALWLISFNDDGNYRPFRSLDRGESWTRLDAGIAGDLTALSVDPGSSGTLYAGTAAGELYKTVDGGASWSLTGSGLPADEIRSLAVDPLGPQVVYLGTALNGIYKSTDGGANWVNVNNNVTMTTVNDVAINPNDSQIVYAADADGVTGNGIYKSTNGGASWTKLPPTLSFDWRPGHLIAIDPTDTDVLYSVNDSEVVKSVDGGTSWTPHTVTDVQVTAIILDPATPQTLYAGTSGQGIFKSTDGAFSWAEVNQGLRGRNFPHVQAHSIEVDSSDPSIVYTGGIVGGYRSTDGGHGWSSMNLPVGEAGALVTHPSDPGVVYAFSGDLWKSSDYGVSWVNWNNGAFSCFGPGDVVMHPTDSQTLYLAGADSCAASADGVYKSTDGGLNWILMNTGLTNPRIHTLEVDPNNGDVVYAGSEQPDGPPTGVFKTVDGAANWSQLGGGLPSSLFPNQIVVHPADSNLVWVVSGMQNGGVYRSTDGGANWQKLLDGNVT
ncbi:MAG: hypothetical protein GY856_25540, partial [bacterium]|nr:hypothetical protein [bacterium]